MLGVIALALAAALFLVFMTIEAERAQREQARTTADILNELHNLGRAVINAETGARGYMITLDRRYLEPYTMGREQFGPSLARLRNLVEPVEAERQAEVLRDIALLTESRFEDLDRKVELVREGRLIEARRHVLSDKGQETMARLRRALREMEEIENRILIDTSTETARAEGRVLPLLGLVVVLLLVALAFGYRLVTRAARAEAEAAQAEALAEARDRADLLAHELNHRVKNMFAVVLAIVRMSARDAPEAKPVTESIAQRIHALLTAHEVTQGTLDKPVASLRALVETTLAPYRSDQCEAVIEGPEVMLPSNRVTPLGLMLHELTTNAVKYGAWSCGGRIGVRWEQKADAVLLRWQEEGVTMQGEPERQGFGSMLMTGSARQLGGSIERSFDAGGVLVTITIPHGSNA